MKLRSTTMTLRLESRLKKQLDKLSHSTRRSRSFLAGEAIRDYVDLHEWQIEEIKKGIREADRGEFAAEKEVKNVLGKWLNRAR